MHSAAKADPRHPWLDVWSSDHWVLQLRGVVSGLLFFRARIQQRELSGSWGVGPGPMYNFAGELNGWERYLLPMTDPVVGLIFYSCFFSIFYCVCICSITRRMSPRCCGDKNKFRLHSRLSSESIRPYIHIHIIEVMHGYVWTDDVVVLISNHYPDLHILAHAFYCRLFHLIKSLSWS